MKKLYILSVLACFGFSATRAQEVKPKLSPVTRAYMLDAAKPANQGKIPQGYVYKKRNDGKSCISGMIKVDPAKAALVDARLKAIDVAIGTKAGNIWTVVVPAENMTAFTGISGISYIQIDEPAFPSLSLARKTTRVDSVQKGYNLPMGYSGKGVIVGIMDFGFDYTHPTMYDTSGGHYRINRVWEMNGGGTAPTGFAYGNELTDTNAIKAKGTDNEHQTHGTCVAGMAAGSGFRSPGDTLYRGMAYEADMILVGVRRDSIEQEWLTGGFSDFVDGVNYIYRCADAAGKPAVVNISWGSQSGPHDGTSLANQAFDAMTGAGKILVMSGGNDGTDSIYLHKTFTATDTSVSTFLRFSNNTYKRTWIDIWGDTSKTFCVNTTLYHAGVAGNSTGSICIDDLVHDHYLIAANGLDTCFVQVITSSSEYNDKPRVTLNIYNKATDSVGITVTGNDGTIDMWNEYYYYGYTYGYLCEFTALGQPWATRGSTSTTVSDMGASKSTLLVGAYVTTPKFNSLYGGAGLTYPGYGAGLLAGFSSRGPMIDGRIKPDITAPGLTIATSTNSFDADYTATGSQSVLLTSIYTDPITSVNYFYGQFSGTSAAAPAASGIVALMLQVAPTITPEKVKSVLFANAIQDFYTKTLPASGTNDWGHGKINAYGAIRQLVKETSVYAVVGGTLDCVLYPNPNNGSCTLDLDSRKAETLRVEVLNTTGTLVHAQEWRVNAGSNQLPVQLSGIAKGLYIVRVSGSEGQICIKTELK